MDFTKFGPQWLSRMLVDGALATVYLSPTTVGLACYAWLCFWILDSLVSVVKRVSMTIVWKTRLSRAPIGTWTSRAAFWLSNVPGWLLKTWVGLPMFSVVQLVLSSGPASHQKLKAMASGFVWEMGVLNQLPAIHFWTPSSTLATVQAVWYVVVGTYIVYTYIYWSAGFDYVRRTRAVGDALVSLLRRGDETSVISLEAAATRLRAAGWSTSAVSSALWFLALINARIMYQNDIYQQMKPNTYGGYRVVRDIGLLAILLTVHPVAAGLYVASQTKKIKSMKKNAKLYSKYFAALPEQFRSELRLPDSAIEV